MSKKISETTAKTELAGTEMIPIAEVNGTEAKHTTVDAIATKLGAAYQTKYNIRTDAASPDLNIPVTPGTMYIAEMAQESLNIFFPEDYDTAFTDKECIIFFHTANGKVTLPDNMMYAGSEAPTFEAGKAYLCSIFNGVFIYTEVGGIAGSQSIAED